MKGEQICQKKERKPVISQCLMEKKISLWSILIDVELSTRGLCHICNPDLPPSSDAPTISNWNQSIFEAVELLLSRLHPQIIVSVVDGAKLNMHKLFGQKSIENLRLEPLQIKEELGSDEIVLDSTAILKNM
ncbi:hypothetical protein O181_077178 [Austropuccinia psidii MF-1]|uniref:Uncharacterized protein n=1 Tax=Austropuccinia psidii MF-1 TaxID=1389203 RepID=A0A9Q3FGG6_9BASI|nr:hypothetical protein [Austropuccinia psidii MF-1]